MSKNKIGWIFILVVTSLAVRAQSFSTEHFDSVVVRVHPAYDSVSKTHRYLFGENYRKEWAAPTKLPVIKISEIMGGLTPTEKGGGHQTHSIRLEDKSGKEWVLRSVEKYPEVLLPEALRETFAKDWLDDNMSAQHPYSALAVPTVAEAVKVPHTNPLIGWVYPDKALGEFLDEFANTVCLLEEREPAGDSDNTPDMLEKLREDNDNKLDSATFFRARILDLLLADWDRHEDQWRWADLKKGDGKNYLSVPRDRDLVFYVNEGLLPKLAAHTNLLSFLQGFTGDIKNGNAFFYNGRKLDQQFLNQFSYEQWMQMTRDFVAAIPDSVLASALQQLPESSITIRYDDLLQRFKQRRDNLTAAMDDYYHFLNKIIDIRTTDKNELVELSDAPNGGLNVNIHKLSKERETEQMLFSRTFDPLITKEIRLYIARGNDSVIVDTHSPIKLRIIGGDGNKKYQVRDAGHKIKVYDTTTVKFEGKSDLVKLHLSNDTLNTAFVASNLYTYTNPSFAFGYNFDEGLLLGIGISAKHEGFRKIPYGSVQQLKVLSALSTSTYRITYTGEWFKVFRNADFTITATGYAPKNTINFFGRGNESQFIKLGDYKTYYRVKFDFYQVDPALRYHLGNGAIFTVGPSLQYYHFNSKDNTGRFINNSAFLIKSYDRFTIDKSKIHAGVALGFVNDQRDSKVIATNGFYLNLKLAAYAGLNSYARSYTQFFPEVSFYRHLDPESAFVIANRTGAGISLGNTTFYQSAFLGGQENLLGYRKYRFSGDQMLYNNLELRVRLKKVESHFIPGQLGIIGFYDIGRVWQKGESSSEWHNGTGGSLYYSPINKAVLRVTAGHSEEGWYPYINIGLRF